MFGANQVRNFFIVTSNDKETVPATQGACQVINKNGKSMIRIGEPDEYGSTGVTVVGTDVIDIKNIRDIRISKPQGIATQTWTIALNSGVTINAGEDYIFRFEFKNYTGFGVYDTYIKSVPVHATTDMAGAAGALFYAALENAIKRNFSREANNPFASVTSSASGVVVTEKTPKYTQIWHQLPVNLELTIFASDDVMDPVEGVKGSPAAANGHVIDAMYDQFLKIRGDIYGMVGYPNVNLTGKNAVNLGGTYYVMDVKYFLQEEGMLNQNSEKELTIACTAKATLEAIAKEITGNSTLTFDAVANSADNAEVAAL